MAATKKTAMKADPNRTEFSTTDSECAQAYLADTYGTPVWFSGVSGTHKFRHVRTGPGPFYLDTFDHTATTECRAEPTSFLACVQVRRGVRTDVRFDERFGPGDVAINGRPGEPLHVRNASARYNALLLPVAALFSVAPNRPEDGLEPLRFVASRPSGPAAAGQWSVTVDYIAHSMRVNPEAMAQRLLRAAVVRLLAATVLATFANTWVTESGPIDRIDATSVTLSRAIDFIEANADLDIGVTDIARAAHVTVRAVQLAFRSHMNTTPTAYVRRVRLHRAREQLLAASPEDGTTIAQVAARWGFVDPSRFAARYRSIFGQLPSQTLRA